MGERRPATPEEAHALANPLRLRILRLCLDEPLTNNELAEQLGRDRGTTLYHVRLLVATGFLEAEEVRRGRRGTVERPYRSTGKSWVLDVSAASGRMDLVAVDALREELASAGSDGLLELARLAIRLRPDDRERLQRRLWELVEEIRAADDPAGDPVAFFATMHRRTDAPPSTAPRRRSGAHGR